MIEDYGLATMLASVYHDAVRVQELKKIQDELIQLQATEAMVRRNKADSLIAQIAKLRVELNRFEVSYRRIVSRTNTSIPSVEEYIQTVKREIKRLAFEKDHL